MSGLCAGLDPGHIGVGKAEMVPNLVDQHVPDDAVYPLFEAASVFHDGDAVEKNPVGQADGIPYALG